MVLDQLVCLICNCWRGYATDSIFICEHDKRVVRIEQNFVQPRRKGKCGEFIESPNEIKIVIMESNIESLDRVRCSPYPSGQF